MPRPQTAAPAASDRSNSSPSGFIALARHAAGRAPSRRLRARPRPCRRARRPIPRECLAHRLSARRLMAAARAGSLPLFRMYSTALIPKPNGPSRSGAPSLRPWWPAGRGSCSSWFISFFAPCIRPGLALRSPSATSSSTSSPERSFIFHSVTAAVKTACGSWILQSLAQAPESARGSSSARPRGSPPYAPRGRSSLIPSRMSFAARVSEPIVPSAASAHDLRLRSLVRRRRSAWSMQTRRSADAVFTSGSSSCSCAA